MPNPNTKKIKILMVDDDKVLPPIYLKKFENAGFQFEVISSPDGDFAGNVAEIKPDLILMDLTFLGSKRNGVEAAEILKLDDKTKNIPLIFLTNADDTDLANKAKKHNGAIGLLVKIEHIPSELVVKVQKLYSKFLEEKNR